jgi:hypothetical protein
MFIGVLYPMYNEIIALSVGVDINLGGSKTLAGHPASTTRGQMPVDAMKVGDELA